MKRTIFAIITALLLSPAAVWSQNTTTVHTKLSKDTIMIGDQITMTVNISKDLASEVMIPQFEKGVTQDIEVVGMPTSIDTLKRDGRSLNLQINYTITSFKAGVHRFEGIPIVVSNKGKNDTIKSDQMLEIVVNTFEIDTTKQQIADIKQPIDTPLQWNEIKEIVYYSLAGAVLLAVIIYFLIRYFKSRKRAIKARPGDPCHVTAIRFLEQLHTRKLAELGRFKEYYSELTDILRSYLENRYGISALEMTTPQIIESLRDVNDEKIRTNIGELFSLADLVKFAKWTPTIEECQENFQMAYYYIEQTKEIIVNNPNPQQDA